MSTHIRIVGILHVALNALQVVGATAAIAVYFLGTALFGKSATEADPAVGGTITALLVGFGLIGGALALLPSLPGFLGGVGLLRLRPWARWVIVIVSVIYLFLPPLHTAVGIYSLWALLNQQAEFTFQATSLKSRL